MSLYRHTIKLLTKHYTGEAKLNKGCKGCPNTPLCLFDILNRVYLCPCRLCLVKPMCSKRKCPSRQELIDEIRNQLSIYTSPSLREILSTKEFI